MLRTLISLLQRRSDLDKSIESVDPAVDSFTIADFTRCYSNKTKSGSQNSCLVDIKPSLEKLDDFCKTQRL